MLKLLFLNFSGSICAIFNIISNYFQAYTIYTHHDASELSLLSGYMAIVSTVLAGFYMLLLKAKILFWSNLLILPAILYVLYMTIISKNRNKKKDKEIHHTIHTEPSWVHTIHK